MNVFNTVTLKQIFWKRKTIFEKLEYQFLVQSTKIEKTIFPHKTALSDVSVKTDRMGSIKWIYNKEWSFPRNYFIFLKILFQLSINYSNFPIYTFHKHWSFIWESFFPVSILKLVLLEIPKGSFQLNSTGAQNRCSQIFFTLPFVYFYERSISWKFQLHSSIQSHIMAV